MRLAKAPKLAMHAAFMNEHIEPLLEEINCFLFENTLDYPELWNIVFEQEFDVKASTRVWCAHIYYEVDSILD